MVMKPSSGVTFAKATLPYPLFAADFDPYNRGYLVVGGGGGESKTGVPNKLTVLDISNRASITTAAEIDLSRDEDSVQSLGNLATKDGLITFAGINSSRDAQGAGKNEHLRAFEITYPPRKKLRSEKDDSDIKGEIKPLGQRSLFRPGKDKSETYQRVLRLSPAQKRDSGSKRIGAVATGMARDSELVVFNATSSTPSEADLIARIDLPEGDEAADIDFAEPEQSEFSMAYCTDYDIYEQTYKYNFDTKKVEKTPNGPRRIHQMPAVDTDQNPKSRPKFRAVRFLNAQNVVALVNKHNKSGAELRIYHLYPTGPATAVLQKNLPTRIKSAVSLDVCALDTDRSDNQQIVVAVAGQDISIEVFTTNYQRATDTFSPFQSFITLRDVHQHQMTKLCLAPFHSPPRAPDLAEGEVKTAIPNHPGVQYVRLASISFGNTVVVDTFALQPFEPENKYTRYVLSHPNDERFWKIAFISIGALMVLVLAFLTQSVLSGFSDSSSGPFSLLPAQFKSFLDSPASAARGVGYGVQSTVSSAIDHSLPTAIPGVGRLRDLLATHLITPQDRTKALVVRDAGDSTAVSIDVHPDREAYLKQDVRARHWEELSLEEQATWKQRLVGAGRWAEGEGEKVLLGVLFSSYAGLVGEVAAGAMG
ncbi:hypothetical protein LTR62_006938 [Meristemomyces frigidus]|uniref:Guanine nucleotide-exchange factor SEC12 n=1 Tax=Meristemomyces frigidus TaxID=1508187 RepID=A0AAN7TMV9_9PEZI|nr:hypothetical protein LTR62_006938 [Meristemomyces frigidus]